MNRLFSIFLLFTAFLSYGQVTLAAGPEEKEFFVNKRFTITFFLEIAGENLVQESQFRMPDFSKFEIIGNASDTNRIFLENGVVNQQIVQWVLEPKQSGRMKIGSALVTVNGKIYKTEPFEIFVKEAEKKEVPTNAKKDRDVYLNVEVENREVYENQPTVAILKAYSRNYDNFRKVKNIKLPQQENINVRPISYQKSEIDPSGEMASQVLAVFIIFPKESGKLEIPPVSAHLSNMDNKIVSNKIKLNVKKLPENSPEDYKNAVGKFDLSITKNDNEALEVDKPFTISVKLSGKGNLNNINLPEIKSNNDFQIFESKIINKTAAENDGLAGEIIAQYVIIPKRAGLISLATENFSYFNPEDQSYVDLGSKSLALEVKTHNEILDQRTAMERVNEYTNNVLETVDSPVLKTNHLKLKEKNSINWKALSINAFIMSVLFMFFLVFKNIQKNNEKNINTSSEKSITNISEEEIKIKNNLQVDSSDYFNYLQIMLEKSDYESFFKTVEDLDINIREQFSIQEKDDFPKFLENKFGLAVSDQYRNLSQKINIEKYAPFRLPEQMNDLFHEIKEVYSVISK